MNYQLPTSVSVSGKEMEIRWDYRAIIDIMVALSAPDLDEQEKAMAAMYIFYPDFDEIPPSAHQEAIERCFEFINCGEEDDEKKNHIKLMDWKQDFPRIAPPVSRVLGKDVRSPEKVHWWSFMGAYMEIGDCLFAQIVSIRDKKARGKKLDKAEQEFYRRNLDIIDIKMVYTEAEKGILDQFT